jgi:hypothetical protein
MQFRHSLLVLLASIVIIPDAAAQQCPTRDDKGKDCVTASYRLDTASVPNVKVHTIDVHNGCGCTCFVQAEESGGTGGAQTKGTYIDPHSDGKIICLQSRDGTGCTGFKDSGTASCRPTNSGSRETTAAISFKKSSTAATQNPMEPAAGEPSAEGSQPQQEELAKCNAQLKSDNARCNSPLCIRLHWAQYNGSKY